MADAHRAGERFLLRRKETLTAIVGLESTIFGSAFAERVSFTQSPSRILRHLRGYGLPFLDGLLWLSE
jgi:hypothetical protein